MEAHPPSYETATVVDVWDIVARYLPSNELCAAALVCSRWHAAAAPRIWGNPASHFGVENDAVYVALTRFKRTLYTARLLVRSLTHTLHLPPAHAEIYNGPQADWLRDILERLPALQSLIVRGLPFFDHAALHSLSLARVRQQSWQIPSGVLELPASTGSLLQSPALFAPVFSLRLLDASRCPNITSSGLASALQRFEGLLYLDLSFSYPARHKDVLETLRRFTGLHVLKLRGLNLKDDAIDVLGRSIGTRVRSLDLRDNHVTDRAIRTLLDHCFLRHEAANGPSALQFGQRSPTLLPYIGSEMLDVYQGEDFEAFLRNAFTGRFVGRLAIEDIRPSGITHLYLTGNPITVEGISGLIRSERLHVLDVGSVPGTVASHPALSGHGESCRVAMPSMEKLTPLLAKHVAETMSFLRIDHSLLTKEPPALRPAEIVQGRVELGDTSSPHNVNDLSELDGDAVRPIAFEMSADVQTPKYELVGDPMRFVVSPAPDQTFQVSNPAESPREARRRSTLAPEVVDTLAADTQNNLLSPVSAIDEGDMTNGWRSAISPVETGCSGTSSPTSHQQRPRSYSSMTVERQARLSAHALSRGNLHPAMLPHVTTLVFTNVPPFSPDQRIADRIILFIKQCAEEASLAKKQALLDYSAPPGRRGHVSALKNSARKIFGLERLVLEVASEQAGRHYSKASPWVHPSFRSVTEDRDSEALWSASEADFSFFGDDECVFPTLDTGRFAFYPVANEKEVVLGSYSPAEAAAKGQAPVEPKFDNVALISSFRKERKALHQRQLAAGKHDVETEGLWHGLIQVVRSNATMRNDEQEDYHGNKFTNKYLYH